MWAFILALGALLVMPSTALQAREQGKKPSLSLKASPAISFAPARIVIVAELKGGDDSEELYCPTVEWEWGDDVRSGNSEDCSPYEAGKSEIKRRYSVEHVFRYEGTYRVTLRLKQKDRVVGITSTTIEVRPGVRDSLDN